MQKINSSPSSEHQQLPAQKKGVHITKSDQLEGTKTRSSIKRLSAVPWLFGGFGLFLTACVIIFILTYQYISLSENVEKMVVTKATTVLEGAVQSVHGYRNKVIRVTGLIQQQLSKAGNTSQDPYYFLNSLNSTLHRTVGTRVRTKQVLAALVYVLGDPVLLETFPKQNLEEQSKCPLFCARPGDPTYTKVTSYALIRDSAPEQPVEYRSIGANPNNTCSFYRMGTVNRTFVPFWAQTNDYFSNKNIITLKPYRVQSFVGYQRNGTSFDGAWSQVDVTSSASGYSYYFTGYNQQFIHPKSKLTISMSINTNLNAFQDVLSKVALSQSVSSNAHLLLVDQLARVITYNHDIYGDRRLANCTINVIPGTPNRPCSDLFGISHPTPFIARLFQNHKAFIMSFSSSARQVWFSDEGSRYLLVAEDISSDAHSRIAAVFVLPEIDVVGDLKRNTLLLVLLSAFLVLVGCLIVVAAGFVSLHNAQRTVVLVAKLASSIARYDVDAADATIAEEQSSRMCMKTATPMEKQFGEIVDNLRTYRPFLPSSLLVGTRGRTTRSDQTESEIGSQSTHSSSTDSIPFPLHVNSNNTFVPFVGSLVLVDIGNLPIAAHVPRRSAEAGGQVINAFLRRCLRIVERHGGVAESIQANQLLASFNCHTPTPLHQQVACRCALELQAALTGESAWCEHRINVAISVTSGAGLLGSGGTATVKGRLIAGETVDLIRRLPTLQRLLGVGVVATEATVTALSGAVVVVPIDVIAPTWGQEGRSSAIVVYEVVATTKLVAPSVLSECNMRTLGFTCLHERHDPAKAATAFLQLPSDVMGRYSVMRLVYLSEVLAKQSYSNLHRKERPWEELEGRAFFDLHKTEMVESMRRKDETPNASQSLCLNLQRAHETNDVNDYLGNSFGRSERGITVSNSHHHTDVSMSWEGLVDDLNVSTSPLISLYTKTRQNNGRVGSSSSVVVVGAAASGSTPSGEGYELHVSGGRGSSMLGISTLDMGYLLNASTAKVGKLINGSARNYSFISTASSSSLRNSSGTNAPSVTAVSGDKYFVTNKPLGGGIIGHVTLALHETGGLVAMKQIPLTALDEGVEPLIQEMELLSSLNHPNIASYVTCAVNQDDNTFCIMNEYLPAGSLFDLLRVSAVPCGQCILSTPTIIKFATDIANGLRYLHTRNPPILHLDVKPQNVLMTAEGSCKLIDFGASKFFSGGSKATSARGTARYMAPEAALGEFSPASDIYSLGITVLHTVLGRPPWDHVPGDDISFLTRLKQDGTLRPNIPDWIDPKLGALLERCTSRDPTHRPSAKRFVEEANAVVLENI